MKRKSATCKTTLSVLLAIAIFSQFTTNGQSAASIVSSPVATTWSNVAQGKTAAASSSDSDSHAANYAFDGNQGTRFASGHNDNQWLTVDLGKAYLIGSVVLVWEKSYGRDFDIQFSNSGTFADLYTDSIQVRNHVLSNNSIAGYDTLQMKLSTVARYVRMLGVHSATGNGYSIWEMQVMGSTATTNLFPVSVTGFTGTSQNNASQLDWTTTTEYNNAGFSVQRSDDAINFSDIAWISGHNTGTVSSHYTFTDTKPAAGKNYYRLKQTWLDGTIGYSSVITVAIGGNSSVNTYPVPAKDHVTVEYKGTAGENISITLFTTAGLPVYTSKSVAQGSQQIITINRTAAMLSGNYFLSIGSSENKYSKQIVFQ